MSAGQLTRRAQFEKRGSLEDGYGNTLTEWASVFSHLCHVRYMRGGESVMASRLEGRQPVIITVRNCAEARTISSDMRCVIDGVPYNVREFPRPSQDRLWLEFLAESGVADG